MAGTGFEPVAPSCGFQVGPLTVSAYRNMSFVERPFESWQQIDEVAEQRGPVYGPMIVFAAATGLRPSELFALEQRDVGGAAGVLYVRRAYRTADSSTQRRG